jgi:hypothetical protein
MGYFDFGQCGYSYVRHNCYIRHNRNYSYISHIRHNRNYGYNRKRISNRQ